MDKHSRNNVRIISILDAQDVNLDEKSKVKDIIEVPSTKGAKHTSTFWMLEEYLLKEIQRKILQGTSYNDNAVDRDRICKAA